MANKKRRRRPQRPSGAGQGQGQGQSGTSSGDGERAPAGRPNQQNRPRADRQERKQQARAAREAAIRKQRRRDTARRFVLSVVVAAVAIGVFSWFTRVGGANPFPAAAADAAKAAGCTGVQTPAGSAPGGVHLASGATHVYPEEPATSGPHDPSPLTDPPAVYTEMPPETRLVHNLEHAFVNIYYRPDGDGALPQDVIAQLATVANGDPKNHVILTPHTSLPTGVGFAVTAWNKLLTCPGTVTASQATTIAKGFVTAFECTSNAPEPKASSGC
jgi:hypothetical protein